MSQKKTNMFEDFMLGGVAAAVSKTIAAPIERIKLLLQNQGESAAAKAAGEYKGIMDCLVRIPKEQGVMSFWRGNAANVVRYFPTQALNFMFKDKYKRMFKVAKTAPFHMRLGSNVAAGGAAGATSLLFVYPLDFARTRLAVDVGSGSAREFNGLFDTVIKTVKTGGWVGKNGVYNGFGVSVIGIVFYRGFYFGIYDTVSSGGAFEGAGFLKKFLLGYAVTVVASTISYPVDTIRRRMMMNSGGSSGPKYTSAINCATTVLKDEGFTTFFKGCGSNILRGLCGALVLVGFDYCKDAYIDWKYSDAAPKAWADMEVQELD